MNLSQRYSPHLPVWSYGWGKPGFTSWWAGLPPAYQQLDCVETRWGPWSLGTSTGKGVRATESWTRLCHFLSVNASFSRTGWPRRGRASASTARSFIWFEASLSLEGYLCLHYAASWGLWGLVSDLPIPPRLIVGCHLLPNVCHGALRQHFGFVLLKCWVWGSYKQMNWNSLIKEWSFQEVLKAQSQGGNVSVV